MDSISLKEEACKVLDALTELLVELSNEIHRTPELSLEEHKAVQLITAILRDEGFEIETGLAGLETAFLATHPSRSNGPIIAFLAEYDALPGIGHACGHNIIAGSAVGAALAVGKIKERLPGTLQIFGCPAEEKGGGKITMIKHGVFDSVDIAMMVHPGTKNSGTRNNLTLVPLEITFEGKSAHASAAPEQGINALSAVIQTFNSINALREHLSMDASIHGIITHGGRRTNIVPDFAQCRFSVRSPRRKHRDELVEKLKNCARGAALAMGCKVRFDHFDQIYDAMSPTRAIFPSVERVDLRYLLSDTWNVVTPCLRPLGRPTVRHAVGGMGRDDGRSEGHPVMGWIRVEGLRLNITRLVRELTSIGCFVARKLAEPILEGKANEAT